MPIGRKEGRLGSAPEADGIERERERERRGRSTHNKLRLIKHSWAQRQMEGWIDRRKASNATNKSALP